MKETHLRLREFKYNLYRIFRNPSAIIGFALLFIFVAVAIFAPLIAPPKYAHNPYMMPHKGFSPTPKPPSQTSIFGTTSGQYDIFYTKANNPDADPVVIGSDNKGYFLGVGDQVYDGTVLAVDTRLGTITFRQQVNDPRLIKPYRHVFKRLVPLDDEESADE